MESTRSRGAGPGTSQGRTDGSYRDRKTEGGFAGRMSVPWKRVGYKEEGRVGSSASTPCAAPLPIEVFAKAPEKAVRASLSA